MAKVGLKETLALLAAGYKKKDIEALAAADEDQNKDPEPDPQPDPEPDPQPDPQPDPEPDYKQLYEDLKKQSEADKATITKLQQNNIHKDSTPGSEEARQKEQESLIELFRSSM